jgi:hypothetical protein
MVAASCFAKILVSWSRKTGSFSISDRFVRARGKLCLGYRSLVRSRYLLRLPKNVTT